MRDAAVRSMGSDEGVGNMGRVWSVGSIWNMGSVRFSEGGR
jgi:hypothetical protein